MIEIRQIKYLNNIVEQSHRAEKWRMRTVLGFKSDAGAEATIDGVELWQMLKKGQLKKGQLKKGQLKKGQLKNAGDMTLWEQFNSLAV